jgi:hypothetical protein
MMSFGLGLENHGATRGAGVEMKRRDFLLTCATLAGAATFPSCRAARPKRDRPIGGLNASAFHVSRRFVATPFGRIAYVEPGSGPAALFLHGFR